MPSSASLWLNPDLFHLTALLRTIRVKIINAFFLPVSFYFSLLLVFLIPEGNRTMSQHPSFKVGGSNSRKRRNVLKRFERITLLRKRGEWATESGVFGLKKTKPDA